MKEIKQNLLIQGKPEDVYDFLVNPRTTSKVTGEKAQNTGKVGGKFSLYNEYIFGTNLLLSPNKKIVQKWACEDFPENHFSTVTIDISKTKDGKTQVSLLQENVPDDFFEELSEAWNMFYWEPLKDWLHEKLFG